MTMMFRLDSFAPVVGSVSSLSDMLEKRSKVSLDSLFYSWTFPSTDVSHNDAFSCTLIKSTIVYPVLYLVESEMIGSMAAVFSCPIFECMSPFHYGFESWHYQLL